MDDDDDDDDNDVVAAFSTAATTEDDLEDLEISTSSLGAPGRCSDETEGGSARAFGLDLA